MNAKQAGIESKWGMPWPMAVRELAQHYSDQGDGSHVWDSVAWILRVSPRTLRRWRNSKEYRDYWMNKLTNQATAHNRTVA